ncbi:MAG: hypothetical protein R2711_03810 [Acidimicrobiales bacterium]
MAHECIVDLRPITKETGVTVDDVAKRLIDFGFHAPTMSFPVPGTLMIEPTESEDLGELDRFCDAMIAIRAEIAKVGAGEWPADDNPLRHAPHTVSCLVGPWDHPTREEAAFPSPRCATATGTGRPCGASMAATATATWSARARRWRSSPSSRRVAAAELSRSARSASPSRTGA